MVEFLNTEETNRRIRGWMGEVGGDVTRIEATKRTFPTSPHGRHIQFSAAESKKILLKFGEVEIEGRGSVPTSAREIETSYQLLDDEGRVWGIRFPRGLRVFVNPTSVRVDGRADDEGRGLETLLAKLGVVLGEMTRGAVTFPRTVSSVVIKHVQGEVLRLKKPTRSKRTIRRDLESTQKRLDEWEKHRARLEKEIETYDAVKLSAEDMADFQMWADVLSSHGEVVLSKRKRFVMLRMNAFTIEHRGTAAVIGPLVLRYRLNNAHASPMCYGVDTARRTHRGEAHPHVSPHGAVCLGYGANTFNQARARSPMEALCFVANQLKTGYHPPGAYISLSAFAGPRNRDPHGREGTRDDWACWPICSAHGTIRHPIGEPCPNQCFGCGLTKSNCDCPGPAKKKKAKKKAVKKKSKKKASRRRA
jgi:hypothetical protein